MEAGVSYDRGRTSLDDEAEVTERSAWSSEMRSSRSSEVAPNPNVLRIPTSGSLTADRERRAKQPQPQAPGSSDEDNFVSSDDNLESSRLESLRAPNLYDTREALDESSDEELTSRSADPRELSSPTPAPGFLFSLGLGFTAPSPGFCGFNPVLPAEQRPASGGASLQASSASAREFEQARTLSNPAYAAEYSDDDTESTVEEEYTDKSRWGQRPVKFRPDWASPPNSTTSLKKMGQEPLPSLDFNRLPPVEQRSPKSAPGKEAAKSRSKAAAEAGEDPLSPALHRELPSVDTLEANQHLYEESTPAPALSIPSAGRPPRDSAGHMPEADSQQSVNTTPSHSSGAKSPYLLGSDDEPAWLMPETSGLFSNPSSCFSPKQPTPAGPSPRSRASLELMAERAKQRDRGRPIDLMEAALQEEGLSPIPTSTKTDHMRSGGVEAAAPPGKAVGVTGAPSEGREEGKRQPVEDAGASAVPAKAPEVDEGGVHCDAEDVTLAMLDLSEVPRVGMGVVSIRVKAIQTERIDKSLFLFPVRSHVRIFATLVVEWYWFNQIVSLCVIGSTLCMIFEDPMEDSHSERNIELTEIGTVFSVLFLIEFLFKIVSMGFVLDRGAYLRNPWNVVDFLCVVSSVVGMVPSLSSMAALKVLRTFRVLRPLVALKRFKTLQLLMDTLFYSMMRIMDVLYVLFAFVFFMGVLGVELFKGRMHTRCFVPDELGMPTDDTDDRVCNLRSNSSGYDCNDPLFPSDATVCGYYAHNPNSGIVSFDNSLVGSLNVFITITLEGWTDTMYYLMDSADFWMGLIFQVVVVVVGGFMLMNLALAVVYDAYMEKRTELEERAAKQRQAELEMQEEAKNNKELQAELQKELQRQKEMFNGLSFSKVGPDWNGMWERAVAFVKLKLEQCGIRFEATEKSAQPKSHMRQQVAVVVLSSKFDDYIMGLIVLNVLFMCMYSYNAPQGLLDTIEWVNMICKAIFTLEFVLKLYAMGLREYFSIGFNRLDFFLVIFSLCMIVVDRMPDTSSEGLSYLGALRALRVIRVFKLVSKWKELQRFLKSLMTAMQSVGPFLVVMLVVMMNAALIGENFFAGKIPDYTWKYDSAFWSMMTTFQVASGENWNDTMTNAVAATSWYAAAYFVVVFFVTNTLMLNIVVSIIIESCSMNDEEEEGDADSTAAAESDDDENSPKKSGAASPVGKGDSILSPIASDNEDNNSTHEDEETWMAAKATNSFMTRRKVLKLLTFTFTNSDRKEGKRYVVEGKAFMMFDKFHRLRLMCVKLVEHKLFEQAVSVCIVVSAMMLAIHNPNHADGYSRTRIIIFEVLNMLFMVLFTAEMLVKMVVSGMWRGNHAYLRTGWNILDFLIVISAWVALATPSLVIMRVLRAFRPLRLFSRQGDLKLVVDSLVQAMHKSGNVCAVGIFIFITFAVSGVQLFSGSFQACTDPTKDTRAACTGTFLNVDTGDVEEAKWVHLIGSTFDDVLQAVVTLFELSTMEMWPDIVTVAMNSTGPNQGPKENARVWVLVYFISVIVLTSFFYLNLFVGIVVDSYTQICSANDTEGLPDELRDWRYVLMEIQKSVPKRTPVKAKRPLERQVQWLVMSSAFEGAILLLVSLNVILMGIQYWRAPEAFSHLVAYMLAVIAWIYVGEAVLKIFGMGWREYFRDRWNCFDFALIMITTILPLIAPLMGTRTQLDWARIFRVLRGTRLLRTLPGVGVLIESVLASVVQASAVLTVILVVTFVYAIMGITLFGDMDRSNADKFGAHANFENFKDSMLLLIRCATGESWNALMHELSTSDSNSSFVAIPFFITYVFIVQLLLLNLLIAVVINNYSISCKKRKLLVNRIHIENFINHWMHYDPNATGFIPLTTFFRMVKSISRPLGYKTGWVPSTPCKLIKHLKPLNIPVYVCPPNLHFGPHSARHCVKFHDVLTAIACRVFAKEHADNPEVVKFVKLTLSHMQAHSERKQLQWLQSLRANRLSKGFARVRQITTWNEIKNTVGGLFKGYTPVQAEIVEMYRIHHWIAVNALERFVLQRRQMRAAKLEAERRRRRAAKKQKEALLEPLKSEERA